MGATPPTTNRLSFGHESPPTTGGGTAPVLPTTGGLVSGRAPPSLTSARRSVRKRRERKGASLLYCLVNVTTAFRLLDVASSNPSPHVILAQEVRAEGHGIQSVVSRLSFENSFVAHVNSPSITEAEGLSGGVAIAAKQPFQHLFLPCFDGCTTTIPEHRAQFRIFDGLLRHGTLDISAYFHTGTDFTGPNWDLLDAIGERIRAAGLPFVLGADFQNPPQALWDTGWVQALDATILVGSGGAPTCFGSGCPEGRCIDYFVVSNCLAPRVSDCWVDLLSGDVKTHRKVYLQFDRPNKCEPPTKPRAPAKFPSRKPIGCNNRPPDVGWVEGAVTALQDNQSPEALEQTYTKWCKLAEDEVGNWFDTSREGQPTFFGREKPTRFVKAASWALHPRGVVAHGEAAMWRALAAKVETLRAAALARHWHIVSMIGIKLAKFTCPFKVKPPQWPWWRARARKLRWAFWNNQPDLIDDTYSELTKLHTALEKAERNTRIKAWTKFACVDSFDNGARAAFRFVKGRDEWVPPKFEKGKAIPSTYDQCHTAAGTWHTYWKASPGADAALDTVDWSHFDLDGALPLQVPSPEDLRDTCKKFPHNTASGADGFHPRHFLLLSDECLTLFCALLACMGHLCCLPRKLQLLMVALLPKPTGGDRPIGIFPTCLRVWTKWLQPLYAGAWEKANPRAFFYGEEDKSCDQAVWIQAATAEAATAMRKHYASSLSDLKKAYENVCHPQLAREAAALGFPLRLLKLALFFYRLPRVITIRGCATAMVRTSQTIVAGCSFATTLMRVVFMRTIDAIIVRHPRVTPFVVVDDVTLTTVSRSQDGASADLENALVDLTTCLEADCHMVVNESKSVIIANTAAVVKSIVARNERYENAGAAYARNLGVDFSAGKRARTTIRRRRIKGIAPRVRRLRRLRAAGAKTVRLVKGTLTQAAAYAASVTGVTDHDLRALRRAVRRASCKHVAGRSLTADLACLGNKVDPAFVANRAPIEMWCKGFWDCRIPRFWICRGFTKAMSEVFKAKHPWRHVKGPAGAVCATLRRIGWKPLNAPLGAETVVKWHTHRGIIDVSKVCPKSVGDLVDEATELNLWRQEALLNPKKDYLGAKGAFMEPITKLLRQDGPDWTAAHRGQLKSLVANGQWPQERLCRAGLGEDPYCLVCGEVGSLHHRLWCCPGQESFRRQYGLDAWVRWGKEHPDKHFLVCPILPKVGTFDLIPPPLPHESLVWEVESSTSGHTLCGDVCGDGSGLNVQVADFRRCGWSAVQIAHDGDGPGVVVAAIYGALPGIIQDVPRAELYGFYKTLVHSLGAFVYHTDCRFVSDGFLLGRVGTTRGGCVHADLWVLVWDKIDDIGEFDQDGNRVIAVTWIKGHASRKLVQEGRLKEWQRDGNFAADNLAKRGARLHPSAPAIIKAYDDRFRFITVLCKFLARVSARVHNSRYGIYDAAPDRRHKEREDRAPRRRAKVRLLDKRHAAGRHGGAWHCWVCCKSAVCLQNLQRKPCVARGNLGHSLWELGPTFFCSRCGAHTERRFRLLAQPCQGRPAAGTTRAAILKRFKKGYLGKEHVGRPMPCALRAGVGGLRPPRYLEAIDGDLLDQPLSERARLGEFCSAP